MSNHLGADKTLHLLDSLKAAVSGFAAREDKLNQEIRVAISREHRGAEAAAESLLRQAAAEVGRADASFQAARETAEAFHQARKTRITEIHKASKRRTKEGIEGNEDQRKFKLQMEMLQSERTREAELAATEKRFTELRTRVAASRRVLARLDQTAANAFRGYPGFLRSLRAAPTPANPGPTANPHSLHAELNGLLGTIGDDLKRFRRMPLPLLFSFYPVLLLLLAGLFPLVPVLRHNGVDGFTYTHAAIAFVVLVAGFLGLYFIGQRSAGPLATTIAGNLVKARGLHKACVEVSEASHGSDLERVENEFQASTRRINDEWNSALREAAEKRESLPRKIEEQASRLLERSESQYRLKLEALGREHRAIVERVTGEAEARSVAIQAASEQSQAQRNADHQARWAELEADWTKAIQPVCEAIEAARARCEKLFPAWDRQYADNWTAPAEFPQAAKFAEFDVDVERLSGVALKERRLVFPGPMRFSLPLLLTYPEQGSVLFQTTKTGREEVIGSLNNIILRLLSTAPPGRLSFTIVDPVGLGQNFAGVMHLADYAEHVINSRIWTHTDQIEQRLGDLNEHMEKVIQMYLRNEYNTIAEYNEQAGNIAEKYHFLVVADFPAGFSDTAIKRLLSIAASGAKCGVYTLIHWDRRLPAAQDFNADGVAKACVSIHCKGNEFLPGDKAIPGVNLMLDLPPPPEVALDFVHKVGRSSRDSNRVEVPFAHVVPADTELWSGETSSELRVPIGRTGATKLQYLAIGRGTRQHALVAGKTGSGKSTLFHVIVTNLALWCSPEEVEFYLIDFKKGVEFKCYATHRLPHAKVVAIESDREFGLSVLQRVDDELKRRGDMFRKLGVQDIAGYKRAGGAEPIPRSLLIIDEFQEFFVEDDRIAQSASLLLDRIVRQGRAFGIHVLLGSQTLGGAYTVARATLGQMVIRIALQCNEADAYLIMDDTNSAPRLLSRPGEGIYNDTAGTVEGNSPFQAVWLPDEVRDTYLAKVCKRADQSPVTYAGPFVFEGDAPADIRENPVLSELLSAGDVTRPATARIWLGAPNSIKGPTEALFQRQGGNNLLLVGQRDEAALAILAVGLFSLAAQYPVGMARFVVFDASPPGSPPREFLESVARAIPHELTLAKNSDLADIMTSLTSEMKSRADDEHAAQASTTFVFIHGLQKFKKLRHEEDFSFSIEPTETTANLGAQLNDLITEGPGVGFHIIVTTDSYNNVSRFLSRKALTEFEMRVLFQMSAADSSSLIDSPKASTLGLHRALYYNEQEGYLELFRPYSLPDNEWIERAGQQLSRSLKQV